MYYFRIVYQRYIILCDICQNIAWTYITKEIYRKHNNISYSLQVVRLTVFTQTPYISNDNLNSIINSLNFLSFVRVEWLELLKIAQTNHTRTLIWTDNSEKKYFFSLIHNFNRLKSYLIWIYSKNTSNLDGIQTSVRQTNI